MLYWYEILNEKNKHIDAFNSFNKLSESELATRKMFYEQKHKHRITIRYVGTL